MNARRNSSSGYDGYEYSPYTQPLQPPQSAPGTFEYYNDDRAHGHAPSGAMLAPLAIPAHGTNFVSNSNNNASMTTSGGMTSDRPFVSADDGGFTASSSTKTNADRGLDDYEYANGYGNKRNTIVPLNPYADANMYARAYDAGGPELASTFYSNKHPESGLTMTGDGSEKDMLDGSGKKRRRQRRKCCGNGMYCWCCSRKCCCIFLPILAVILVALGITLFFVFPRIPKVTFTGISVAKTGISLSSDSSTTGSVSDLSKLAENVNVNRQGVVTVPLIIHLNVTNPNYIPWTIHNVTVDGLLRNTTAGGSDFPVGNGFLTVPFNMPKRTNSNDMPIQFNFKLDTSNNNYLAAAEIVQASCSPGGQDLRFHYSAKVILRAISWLGIKPVISDTISFACPISDIESLGISLSNLTGLLG